MQKTLKGQATLAKLIVCLLLWSFMAQAQNVGINTSTPVFTLDVRGTAIDEGALLQLSNADQSHRILLFGGREGDPNPFLMWKTSSPMRFVTDEGGFRELMRIQGNGNVGIGLDNPSTILHIKGDDDILTLDEKSANSVGTGAILRFKGQTADNMMKEARIGIVPEDNTFFHRNGALEVRIPDRLNFYRSNSILGDNIGLTLIGATGNVGIGVTDPTERLQISGTAKATAFMQENGDFLSSGPKAVIEFSNVGTTNWVCPANVYKVMVEVWGAGGGGGGGGSVGTGTVTCGAGTGTGGSSGGGGGAGGAYIRRIINVTPGQSYSIIIGNGGTAGAVNANGGAGGLTEIKLGANVLVSVVGGGGGAKGTATSGLCPTLSGGAGGVGTTPAGNFVKRKGKNGAQGESSRGGTLPGGGCGCGVTSGSLSAGGGSIVGSLELPAATGIGGQGGSGATNNSGQTAGQAGGKGYVMITTY